MKSNAFENGNSHGLITFFGILLKLNADCGSPNVNDMQQPNISLGERKKNDRKIIINKTTN